MTEQVSEKERPVSFFVSSGLLAFFILLASASYLTTPLGSSEYYARLNRAQRNTGSLIDEILGIVETAAGEHGLIFLKFSLIFLFMAGLAASCAKKAKSQFLGFSLAIFVAACSLEGTSFDHSLFSLPSYFIYEVVSGLDLSHFFDYRIAGVIILLILFICFLRTSKKFSKIEAVLIFLAGLFSIIVPNFAIWPMSYLAFSISRIFGEEAREQDRISGGILELQRRLSKLPADGLVWLATVFCILNIRSLYIEPVVDQFFPIGAMNYVVENELDGAILSAPVIGSYIDYRLGISSFAHAAMREDLISKDPKSVAFASKLFKNTEYIFYLIEQYGAKTALCINTDALCKALSKDPNWQKVYPKEAESVGVYNWNIYRILPAR